MYQKNNLVKLIAEKNQEPYTEFKTTGKIQITQTVFALTNE